MALKQDWDELEKGDWYFMNNDSYIVFQWGEDRYETAVCIPIQTSGNDRYKWNWNGDKEYPTLTPSILVFGNGMENPGTWHGFLTDGKLVIA